MSIEHYFAFVAAASLLIVAPGPNVALIIANSLAHGVRCGLITVAGTSAAILIQLSLTVAGLSGLLAILATWFDLLRWLAVGYLVYLGFKTWHAPAPDLSAVRAGPGEPRAIFLRAFLVSLTNPKTLLFYAAFLPQFISATGDPTPQLVVLAVTFLSLALMLDSSWVFLASRARGALRISGRTLNRLTGGLLMSAAAGLALARRT